MLMVAFSGGICVGSIQLSFTAQGGVLTLSGGSVPGKGSGWGRGLGWGWSCGCGGGSVTYKGRFIDRVQGGRTHKP